MLLPEFSKWKMLLVLSFSLLIIQNNFVLARSNRRESVCTDPAIDEKGNAYLDRQHSAFLDKINTTLQKYPPQYPQLSERIWALYLLDAVLHDPYAAYRRPVQEFFNSRMILALDQIEHSIVTDGAIIWKLYNMGFIVRTKSVTIAFDLVRGSSARAKDFALSEEMMHRFVKQCDVLFISHRHRDHVDEQVAQFFIDDGKPVVAPPQVWSGKPIYRHITHLKRKAHEMQSLAVQNGRNVLKVVVYPGHQMAKTENNVPLVFTPEGLSFSHMGDQINEGDFMIDYDWIDKVADHYHVDVLMPPCWTNEIYRIVKGFNPKVVIPGHENELGHPIDDRVPFWGDSEYLELTYPELKNSDYPTVIMTWGESFLYKQSSHSAH